jgi:hypothetical protein
MARVLPRMLVVGLLLGFAVASLQQSLAAGEPPRLEQMPAAHDEATEIIILDDATLYRPFMRLNRYEVWQYYAVDRFGRFRPKVNYSVYGSYYLYNGEPYPWTATHQLDFMPYVVD